MKDIEIIYKDENMLVINKPAGLIVHDGEESVAEWLIRKYPEIKGVGEDESRPGIVHRLDKDTSGVLLIARNQETFGFLKKQFQDKKIKKKYIALVCGNVKDKSGIINLPIGKSKHDFRKKISIGEMTGKTREAITEYKVIEKFEGNTLLEVYPKTGRTHQIRVHLKSIGHPIVCDRLYGFKNQVCPPGLNRHFLHASSVEFTDINGARISFEADLPDDLAGLLKNLRSK